MHTCSWLVLSSGFSCLPVFQKPEDVSSQSEAGLFWTWIFARHSNDYNVSQDFTVYRSQLRSQAPVVDASPKSPHAVYLLPTDLEGPLSELLEKAQLKAQSEIQNFLNKEGVELTSDLQYLTVSRADARLPTKHFLKRDYDQNH